MAINPPQNVISTLRKMSDPQLQQYAAMHKNDPYIFPLAFQESQTRKQIRAEAQAAQAMPQGKVNDQNLAAMAPQPLPEDVGIGQLPADNLRGIATGAAGGLVSFGAGGEVPRYNGKTKYGSLVQSESEMLGLDPDMMMRLFGQESSWNPKAVSPKGAKYGAGIAQLSEAAAADMGLDPEDRYVPEKAIPAALRFYKRQLDKFGSNDKALAAYNWGPANVEKHLAKTGGNIDRIGLPKETADYLTKILPMGSAQAAPVSADKAAAIPGQSVTAPAKQPEGGFMSADSFQRGAESLGLSRDVGRNIYNTLMAPTPLAPASTIPKAGPGLFERLGEKIYNKFVPPAGLTPEGIAALRADSELARKVTPEAQLLLTGPQAKLPGTNIPVTQAGQGITDLVAPARMVPPGQEATRLEQMAAAANARKAAQAAQGAETGTTATKAASLAQDVAAGESAAEKIQRASLLREAEEAARLTSAAQTGQAAKTGAGLTAAAATAAGNMGVGAPFGDIDLGATDASLGAVGRDYTLSKADKTELKDIGREAVKEAGEKTRGFTGDDFIAIGLGILSGQNPNALTNIGEGGLKGLAMRQARIKEEGDAAYRSALGKYYTAGAEAIERGSKERDLVAAAEKAAHDAFTALSKDNFDLMLNPAERTKLYNRLRMEKFMQYGISPTMLGSGPATGGQPRFLGFESNPPA